MKTYSVSYPVTNAVAYAAARALLGRITVASAGRAFAETDYVPTLVL